MRNLSKSFNKQPSGIFLLLLVVSAAVASYFLFFVDPPSPSTGAEDAAALPDVDLSERRRTGGMFSFLDFFTLFLDNPDAEEMFDQAEGEYAGGGERDALDEWDSDI